MTFTYPALFHRISEGNYRGGYFVKFSDLPGCATQAYNLADARAYAAEAMAGWIEVGLECGDAPGAPSDPSTLHVEDGFVELVTSEEVDPGIRKN